MLHPFFAGSLRRLFINIYSKVRKHPVHRFWHDVVQYQDILELTDEERFLPKKNVQKKEELPSPVKEEPLGDSLIIGGEPVIEPPPAPQSSQPQQQSEDSDSDSDLFASNADYELDDFPKGRGFKLKDSDRELFCLGRTLGTQEYVGQRVLQVATILRNLSFIEENVPVLVKNKTFVRFFLLCASSRWAHLRNLGMDMLCNVATEFLVKDLPNDELASWLLRIVGLCLQSEDRACCISSLEVLNKLSQNEANEDAMLRHLESGVYEKVRNT